MKLTILDRITITGILPKKSDFVTLRIVKELKKRLSFTEEERKEYGLQTILKPDRTGSSIVWNTKGREAEFDIKIEKSKREMIISQLDELNKSKKANNSHLALYDKVVAFHEEMERKLNQMKKKKV